MDFKPRCQGNSMGRNAFSIMVLEQSVTHKEKNEPNVLLHSRYKNNSKSILELNFKGNYNTLGRKQNKILWSWVRKVFFNVTPKALLNKNMKKNGLHKIKNIYSLEVTVSKIKILLAGVFPNHLLVSRIYKEFSKLNYKKNDPGF